VKRTGIKRGGKRPAYRPAPLTPEEEAARDLVRRRSGGWCELRIDGVCQGAATNYQHRRATAHGGPTTASNGIDVCGMGNVSGCHGYLHQNPTEAVAKGWTVKSGQSWQKRAVLLFDGFVILGDDGQRYDPPHALGCAVWTSDDDPCDCEEKS
jgi:hypothetical protein